jgi:hypothetical protein
MASTVRRGLDASLAQSSAEPWIGRAADQWFKPCIQRNPDMCLPKHLRTPRQAGKGLCFEVFAFDIHVDRGHVRVKRML